MIELRSKLSAFSDQLSAKRGLSPRAFTLVEMLVAMAITLVMMAAVVTLFANVSNSVRNRRAIVEMTNQLRQLRNVLQQDLAGATCPGLTWQKTDSNHGYIELIEGAANDRNPTSLITDLDGDGVLEPNESQLNPALSPIPRNNVNADANLDGKITTQELEAHYQTVGSLVPGGLGDYDDTLKLTTRNEHEPFVGRMPTGVRLNANRAEPFDVDDNTPAWGYETVESPLAEVIWFCIENPSESGNPNRFFGEPGMRTVYRRVLLIAPWLNPYRFTANNGNIVDTFSHDGGDFKAEPGLMRVLPDGIAVEDAIAAIIAFQDRYDLSVRLDWDPNVKRWKIVANTLADLTKRENRFGNYGFKPGNPSQRIFPYAFISWGSGYSSGPIDLAFVIDPEINSKPDAEAEARIAPTGGAVADYSVTNPGTPVPINERPRPFVYVEDPPSGAPATAQAMLNDDGQVVRVVHGPVPLWGARRGQDVMMTDVLGFDLRVFDPGAPLYGRRENLQSATSPLTVLQPSDPGWRFAYNPQLGLAASTFEPVGQGAYVDMGYAFSPTLTPPAFVVPPGTTWTMPWFADPQALHDTQGRQLAPGYAVYDTWSFHYENNGRDDDARDGDTDPLTGADEGTNGFDDKGYYPIPGSSAYSYEVRLGPDDNGERETAPPYDKPLRGIQVLVRTYEPDARSIRQVKVNQHFMPE